MAAFHWNDIAGPKNPPGHFERPLDCEEALEENFSAALDNLVEAAVSVGWSTDEADEALFSLSHARRWSQIMYDKTVTLSSTTGTPLEAGPMSVEQKLG
jgi:hypothetical protein